MAMASGRLRTPGKRVHSEPTRRPIVRSAALKGAEAERWLQRSLLTSKIYDTVDESVAEPAACWGKARPLQPPAQPYAREYHKLVDPSGLSENSSS